MERELVKTKVIDIMAKILGIDPKEITEEQSLIKDLEIASMEVMEILGEIEEQFDLRILEEESSKFLYVKDIVTYVVEKSKE